MYVGSSVNFRRRKAKHLTTLKGKNHHNIKLQRHVNKHTLKDLVFSVLEIINNPDDLTSREQHYIDEIKPYFNVLLIAGSQLGVKASQTRKSRMSKSAIKRYGVTQEQENRFKIVRQIQKHKSRHRMVIAECPHCKSHKPYQLQALRKRQRINCGCIKCSSRAIPPVPRETKPYVTTYCTSLRTDNTIGWNGVARGNGKFRARIKHKGKLLNTGYYPCPTLAAIARDKYIIENNMPHPTQVQHRPLQYD